MKLTPFIRSTLYAEIGAYADRDAYISDMALSSVWDDAENGLAQTDGQPVWIDGHNPHWALFCGDGPDAPRIVHGLGCVDELTDTPNMEFKQIKVLRENELHASDLLGMDKALVYVEDTEQGRAGFALVEANPDAISLYLGDAEDEECSYLFEESAGWAGESELKIFSCREDEHTDAEIPAERLALLGAIWDGANSTIPELIKLHGLTQADFAQYFNIPLRTVQHWYLGDRACPPYVIAMAAEILAVNDQ